LYWFCIEEQLLVYFFATTQLSDFDGTDWAYLSFVQRALNSFALLVIMPIVSSKLQIHETIILVFISISVAIAQILGAFVTKEWQLWVTQSMLFLQIAQYATARSLVTKCIHPDEIGKVSDVVEISQTMSNTKISSRFFQ
jgi:hypothetical protein